MNCREILEQLEKTWNGMVNHGMVWIMVRGNRQDNKQQYLKSWNGMGNQEMVWEMMEWFEKS